MGQVMSTATNQCLESVINIARTVRHRAVRGEKRLLDQGSTNESDLERSLHEPKRRKLTSTAQYIFKTLYGEGKDSDVTISILNKEWKLHKIYLLQSPYFSSMFSGAWNESNKSHIEIQNCDPLITHQAINVVFGSFYLDEVTFEPCEVVGVLAAASLFQLDCLIEQCSETMMENISQVTAVQYLQASTTYGLKKVKTKILEWFRINLTIFFLRNDKLLRTIDPQSMLEILKLPELCIVQSETFLYLLLRRWVFLRCHPEWESGKDASKATEDYFRRDPSKKEPPFLLTQTGSQYFEIFSQLRLWQVLLHSKDVSIVTSDNIIPDEWLLGAFRENWTNFLGVVSGIERGPRHVDESFFNAHCMRLGRIVNKEKSFWRWSGFSFGVDLIWSVTQNSVLVKRQPTLPRTLVQPPAGNLVLRVEVFNLDSKGQTILKESSGIVTKKLLKARDVCVMLFNQKFDFPVVISVNFLPITFK